VSWSQDKLLELQVTGVADEVESVTRRLAAELAPKTEAATEADSNLAERKERWVRSRKAWAFAIGLTTIAGGVAAVLALFIH
jgi:hypothetical protein